MREFTTDIESRLDKAYKTGASKKYGYDTVSNMSRMSSSEDERDKKESKTLNKL